MNITEITPVKPESNEPIRLAAYCRVSSDSEDQLHSFAAQIRYYTDYAKNHPEYSLVDIYADEGLSGTSMQKRDELNRMLRDCKRGKIDRIVTKSVSRFARNTHELLTMLRMLKEMGIGVYFEEQGIDTDKMNMELIVTFPGLAAQQESIAISENMRWSYKKRMESGEFNTCSPAYGFDLVKGELVINEDEACVIRRIFDLYLKGKGTQAIAKTLSADGVPCRKNIEKWNPVSVLYIINNERYMGDALLQRRFTTDSLPFRRVGNHGEKPKYYVENANQAIISKEVFYAAQEMKKKNGSEKKCRRESSILTRLMRCPECGRAFRKQITGGTAYWMCSGQASGETSCTIRRVREDMVFDTYLTMLYKLKDSREAIIGTLIKQLEQMKKREYGANEEVCDIDRRIADLAARNHVLARLHTSGVLNSAEFAAQSGEINASIAELRIARRKATSEDDEEDLIENLQALNELIAAYEPSEKVDESLFEQVVQSITVMDNTKLTLTLLGGVALTEEIKERGRCRRK
ncbi:MAG: recombinase family protein [Clostridia bacterium]|nr:recombinase family protein [Clostridia bacterium]